MRKVSIEHCWECPKCIYDPDINICTLDGMPECGLCKETNKVTPDIDVIPDWCPLEAV